MEEQQAQTQTTKAEDVVEILNSERGKQLAQEGLDNAQIVERVREEIAEAQKRATQPPEEIHRIDANDAALINTYKTGEYVKEGDFAKVKRTASGGLAAVVDVDGQSVDVLLREVAP